MFSSRPATRRTAGRLGRDSEDSLPGSRDDVTRDLPHPPQPLKVEEVIQPPGQTILAEDTQTTPTGPTQTTPTGPTQGKLSVNISFLLFEKSLCTHTHIRTQSSTISCAP